MAKNSKDRLKEILLFAFVIVCIALIAFQWVDGIMGDDGDINPGFVRPTLQNFEVDDEDYQNWNQLETTPTKQHRKTHTPESTPTPNH